MDFQALYGDSRNIIYTAQECMEEKREEKRAISLRLLILKLYTYTHIHIIYFNLVRRICHLIVLIRT